MWCVEKENQIEEMDMDYIDEREHAADLHPSDVHGGFNGLYLRRTPQVLHRGKDHVWCSICGLCGRYSGSL